MIDHHVRYENDHRFYGTRKIIPFKKWWIALACLILSHLYMDEQTDNCACEML